MLEIWLHQFWSFNKFLVSLPKTDLVLGSCVRNLVTSFWSFNSELEISGILLIMDLRVIDMSEFDVILRMD